MDRSVGGLTVLATSAAAGAESDRARLWAAASRWLVRIALARGDRPEDVEDLVQDVCLNAFRRLDQFDPERGSFEGWLLRSLHNRRFNRLRAWGRRREALRRLADTPRADRSHEPHRRVERAMLLRHLASPLTRREREVVAFHLLAGLTARETGSVLGISESRVLHVKARALARLRERAASETTGSTGPNLETGA